VIVQTSTRPLSGADAPPPERHSADVERAIAFLARQQLPWGELAGYRYAGPSLAGVGLLDSSPFTTTFAVYSLWLAGGRAARSTAMRGADFLLAEREEPGLWRYWSSRNPASIDPDLDDTCCASFVLRLVAPERFTGGNEAAILARRTEGGLFRTWVRGPGQPNDVDGVVMANVLLYLGERAETERARNALVHVVQADRESEATHYYLDPLALHHALARARLHGAAGLDACRDAVLGKVRARQEEDGSWGDALHTALALSTLAGFGEPLCEAARRGREWLAGSQRQDGGWPARAFWAGPEPPGPRSVWWGSDELTTALCLEALVKSAPGWSGRPAHGPALEGDQPPPAG
jgi:hypothetical protein